jgi:hypothetical protein
LLNELRVTGTGIQVLLAFLLIVPFNVGYRRTDRFEHVVYFAGLLLIAAAAVLLIAPSVHHRLLFRHHQRAFIVDRANQLAITGMALCPRSGLSRSSCCSPTSCSERWRPR